MKFIHLGDLHLGRSLSDFHLQEDQEFIIRSILEIASRKKADALVIAGDVYDRANPGDGAMNLLDELLTRSAEAGMKTYLISGNHDSDDKLNFASRFFAKNNVFIYSVFDGTLHKETFTDEYGEVNIYMLPFVKASQVQHFYPDQEMDTYEDAVRTVLENAHPDPSQRNILIAHQFVAGKGENEAPRFAGSESPSVKNVGNVERIGYSLFDDFDYTALGHIHSPQRVGREEVRYSGSPLKYSLSEAGDAKTLPLVTLGEKGQVSIELIPLKPLRDLRHIKGKKDRLLARENLTDTEDFIYVTLTDEEIIDDAMGIFQQYYPNTVKIDYDNRHTRELEQPDLEQPEQGKSFEQLTEDFYRQMYGCEISEEELQMMREIAREAGIADEAH